MNGPSDTLSVEAPAPGVLLRRLAVGLLVLFVAIGALGYGLRGPIEGVSEGFVEHLGLLGIFFGVILLDSLPMTTHEPLLLFGWSGGLGFWSIFAAAASGSVLSGLVGYAGGRVIGRSPRVQGWFVRWHIHAFLHRYGVASVAVAALTPFPFAVATWGAGAVGLPLRHLLLGALFRIPKVLFYLSLIAFGWQLGG